MPEASEVVHGPVVLGSVVIEVAVVSSMLA